MADQDFNIRVVTSADIGGFRQTEAEITRLETQIKNIKAQIGGGAGGLLAPVPSELLERGSIGEKAADIKVGYEGIASHAKEVERSTLLWGANLTRARQETIILMRELATGAPSTRTLGSLLGSLGLPFAVAAIAGIGLKDAIESAGLAVIKLRGEVDNLTRDTGASPFLKTAEIEGHLNDVTSKLHEIRDQLLQTADIDPVGKLINNLTGETARRQEYINRLRKEAGEDIDKLAEKQRALNKATYDQTVFGEYKAKLDQIEIEHNERIGKIKAANAAAGIQFPAGQDPAEIEENKRRDNAIKLAGYEEGQRKIKVSGAADVARIEADADARRISTGDARIAKLQSELNTAKALLDYWSKIEDKENPDLLQKRLDVIKAESALIKERAEQFSKATGGIFEPQSTADRLGAFIRAGGASGAVLAEREREAQQQRVAQETKEFEATRRDIEARQARGAKVSPTELAAAGLGPAPSPQKTGAEMESEIASKRETEFDRAFHPERVAPRGDTSKQTRDDKDIVNWLQKIYQQWQ